MKKVISFILAVAMICSVITMPVSAQSERESLLEREVQYIDILSTARAGSATPDFRDSFKKDGSFYSEKEASVFTQNRTNTTFHEILNAMWVGFGYTQKASFSGSNQTVHFFDLTNGGYQVLETGKKTGSRAKAIDTNGTITYEKGADEQYGVNYYKFGDYKLGPVSVEDDDPATDVFYSPNSVLLGGTSTGASVSSQTFENLNAKGKYLKLLINTMNFEGDASIIPVKVDYTTGNAETFYVFTTKNDSADRLSTLVKVLPKKSSGSYTQQELVDNSSKFVYLTEAKRKELGITAEDLDDITFDGLAEGTSLIFPEKTAIKFCNRNKNGAAVKTAYIEDVTLPLDTEREVSKVTITSWYAAVNVDAVVAPYDERLTSQKTTTYHKITIPGYNGNNEFYALFGRTCQQRSVLLGMSVLGLNDAEKIEEVNAKIEKLDINTATKADCDAIRAEIEALRADNSDILYSDFNISKIEQIEKKIEDESVSAERKELLNKSEFEYVEIPYTVDAFATAADVYKYYPRDSNYTIYPTTDVDGNAITNHISSTTMDKKSIGKKIFVIESILGDADGKLTGSYLDSSNKKASYSATLKINGNDKFTLQSTEADGAMNFIYNHNNVDFKMGPIGGTGAHLTAEGGYNAHLLSNTVDAYNVKGSVKNHSAVNILMSTDFVNSTGNSWAGFFPVKITYKDGTEFTKYLLSTALHPGDMAKFMEVTGGSSSKTGDGDRLAKTVIYVPKGTDISTGANIRAAEKYLSESNSKEIIGKAITLDDVKFPNDDLIIKGQSALFGDYNHARANAFANGRQYCPIGYVDFLQIPVENDVASIKMERNIAAGLNWKDENGNAVAIKNSNTAYIPVTIEGASEDYLYFAKIGRLCENQQEIYAVTISGDSLNAKIAAVERRIQNLSDSYVEEELEEINAIKEEIKRLTTTTIILESDFNAKAIEKLNRLSELHSKIDEYDEMAKDLIKLIDALPEKYSKDAGKSALVIKNKISELAKDGLTEDIIKSLSVNYGKYESHLATYNEWLNLKNPQDRIAINWTEKDSKHAVDIFEFSTATIEEIPAKQAIVMNDTNTVLPSTYKYGSFIGFYSTDSAKNTYKDTFPDKYNQYYITNNGITYGYSGISEKVGENTYNAGIVAPSYGYEIPFDGTTKYKEVNILANGITFLSGEHSRQLQAIKTKVFFTDGTSKEEISIVGNFGYSYRMALYSMLEGDTLPYSEFISQRIRSNLNELWYPAEANVSSYFKLAPNSLRAYYKSDKTTKAIEKLSTLGRASTITIDTHDKAIEKVTVNYATEADLKSIGGVAYNKYIIQETKDGVTTATEKESKNTYYIPVDKAQLKDVTGYAEDRDYYMAVIISSSYPTYLHGVTGVKTSASSYAEEIAKIEGEIEKLSDDFDVSEFSEIKDIETRIGFLEKQGVARESFSEDKIDKLESLLDGVVGGSGHYEIYVSPNGDDTAYGTIDTPVRTLERAKALARTYNNDRPIDIILLEGVYNLTNSFELSAFDSGTKSNPVTIKGEGAVITTADTLSYYDFEKVSEKEASERLQPKVAGKVLKLDLSKYGIDAREMPIFESTFIRGDGFEDVTFFVNDKEQDVAQYPNGESNYESWVSVNNTSLDSAKIQVNANHAKKWQSEKFAYFEGYPGPDYSNERNNITIEGDLLCFKNKARFELYESSSRRYKVKHVLYELDAPGEWYIDRDTNVLYYYPSKDFNEDSKIQISARKVNAFTTSTGLTNFNFNGIKFDKIRGNAITAGYAHENVNIYNCEFTNISNIAVRYSASTNSPTLANIANYTDAAKNCEIRNNRFVNIGSSAISFIGGNRSTLSDGNNVIANNYIYNASDKQKCNPDVTVSGVYNYVVNNEIHMGTFHAINHSGNENVIAYNELYNMLRDTGDCGVIYNGRQLATRGTEIAYNYIHDYKHLDNRTTDNGVGIYLDDRLSGISIHHNIIFSNGVGEDANGIQNGGGQHNKINYNTIVDADETMTRTNRFTEDYKLIADCTAFNEIIGISGMSDTNQVRLDDGNYKTHTMYGRNELFFERYPEMNDSVETLLNPNETVPKFVEKYPFIKTLPEFSGGKYGNLAEDIAAGNDLTKYRILSLKSTIGNEYIGNIANRPWRAPTSKDNDGNVYDVYEKFGSTIKDNVTDASTSMFVDYANQDFRIKGSTNGGALDESFDLNTIGLQADGSVSYDLGFELNDVELKNPKAGIDKTFEITYVDTSDKSNVFLMWERPVSSDYFTVEIATDEGMNNIIYKNEDVYFARLNVDLSAYSQDKFYYRVTARNIGRKGESWVNSDGTKTIKPAYQVSVDIYKDAAIPFDISADFNVDVFNNEGETHSNKNNLGGTGADGTLGMYNLTNLKRIVPSNGYYEYGGTYFHFPQVSYDTSKKNAISTQSHYDSFDWVDKLLGRVTEYKYTLKSSEQGYYDKVKLAMSASFATKDYQIKAYYTDGTSETLKVALHQYYTTFHSYEPADVIITVDGVNSKGQTISSVTTSNPNKIYQAVIDTNEAKVLSGIEFIRNSGTVYGGNTNDEYIFAITGVQADTTLANGNKMQAISMKNYSGANKDANVIITGYIDGEYTVVIVPVTIKNNQVAGILNIEIPEKVERMTGKAMYLWERDPNSMKPFATKLPVK